LADGCGIKVAAAAQPASLQHEKLRLQQKCLLTTSQKHKMTADDDRKWK